MRSCRICCIRGLLERIQIILSQKILENILGLRMVLKFGDWSWKVIEGEKAKNEDVVRNSKLRALKKLRNNAGLKKLHDTSKGVVI